MKPLKASLVLLIFVLAAAGGIYSYGMFLPQRPPTVATTTTLAGPTATSTMTTYETSSTSATALPGLLLEISPTTLVVQGVPV